MSEKSPSRKAAPTSADPHDFESALCTSCGMCCDNTMFGRVIVDEDEAKKIGVLGIDVIEYDDGELSFNQPCPRINKGTCQVYKSRPWTCQSYVCETIKDLRTGKVDADGAQARVNAVHQAKKDLAPQIGKLDPFEVRNAVTDALEEGRAPDTLEDCTPELIHLETLLNRWFREDSYKKTVPKEA